jgi:hypothetical protein
VIEHWCSADTKALRPRRALAFSFLSCALALCVKRWKPEGTRPNGARSERSGDDSAVPALQPGDANAALFLHLHFNTIGPKLRLFSPSGAAMDRSGSDG